MFASDRRGCSRTPRTRSTLVGTLGNIAVAAVLAFGWSASLAGLGERVDSVERDHAALHGASLVHTPMVGYVIHDITMANGTQVREYASPGGTVFAAAWSGRSLPDLKVVLGPHYFRFASHAQDNGANPKVVSLNADGLVLEMARLPRGFVGSAHLPDQLPAGVGLDALR